MTQETMLYVVRHGQTMFNLLDRAQGWADSPLTPAGEEAAAQLGLGLSRSGVVFSAAWSSDSGRARDTGRILLDHMGQQALPLHTDRRLREWCLGDMEGLPNRQFLSSLLGRDGRPISIRELNARLPEAVESIHTHLDSTGMSESYDDLRARLLEGLSSIARETAGQGGGNVLVVSHALSIKLLIHLLCPDRMEEAAMLHNASVCRFRFADDGFQALELNDTRYLDGSAVPAR